MYSKKVFLFAGILIFNASVLSAAPALPQINIQNLRSKAMGGVRLAIVDDQYAMMNNPAAPAVLRYTAGETNSWRNCFVSLIQAQCIISEGSLLFWYHQDSVFEAVANVFDFDFDTGLSIDDATWSRLASIRFSAGTTPFFLTLQNVLPLHLSLAFFDSLNMRIKSNPTLPLPTWDILAYNDMAVVLNFAYTIQEIWLGTPKESGNVLEISFGANAKVIRRTQFGKEGAGITCLAAMTDADVRRGLAFGMDLGVAAAFYFDVDVYAWATQRRPKPDLTLSLACTDFFRTRFSWAGTSDSFGDAAIEPSLAFGVAWRLGAIVPSVLDDFTLAVDMRDIFSDTMPALLKLYAGFEFSVIDVFKIRCGIYQGYVSGGLGIDIPVLPVEIDFAYWAEELGKRPGQERADNFGAALNLVF